MDRVVAGAGAGFHWISLKNTKKIIRDEKGSKASCGEVERLPQLNRRQVVWNSS
jgi:hypothetical protein